MNSDVICCFLRFQKTRTEVTITPVTTSTTCPTKNGSDVVLVVSNVITIVMLIELVNFKGDMFHRMTMTNPKPQIVW